MLLLCVSLKTMDLFQTWSSEFFPFLIEQCWVTGLGLNISLAGRVVGTVIGSAASGPSS